MNSQAQYVTYRAPKASPTIEQRMAARARLLVCIMLLITLVAFGFGWWHAKHPPEDAWVNWGYFIALVVGCNSPLPALAWWAFHTKKLTAAMLRPGDWMQKR